MKPSTQLVINLFDLKLNVQLTDQIINIIPVILSQSQRKWHEFLHLFIPLELFEKQF